jgi:hypothetical protein
MIINNVDNNVIQYDAIQPSTAADRPIESDSETPEVSTTSAPIVDSFETAAAEKSGSKGVLRLLQQGHFKGVADVRLRINFHDDIAAMEQAQAAAIANEGSSDILETVTSGIDTMLKSENLDEQATEAIGEALGTLNTSLTNSTDNPLEALKSAFDQFVTSFNSAFESTDEPDSEATTATSTPAQTAATASEPTVAADEGIETPVLGESSSFDYNKFIADMIDTFTQKLNEVQSAIDNIQVLPELSQPSGKGGAYDKFLAIYNQINGQLEPGQILPEIDTAV